MSRPLAFSTNVGPKWERFWVQSYSEALVIFASAAAPMVGIWTGQAKGSYLAILDAIKVKSPKVMKMYTDTYNYALENGPYVRKNRNPLTGKNATKVRLIKKGQGYSFSVKFGLPYYKHLEAKAVPGKPSSPWHSVSTGFAAIRTYIKSKRFNDKTKNLLKDTFGSGKIKLGEK